MAKRDEFTERVTDIAPRDTRTVVPLTIGYEEWADWRTLEIFYGEVHVLTFQINPRYNNGERRRPKSQAVYISSHHPMPNRGTMGCSVPFAQAIEIMKKVGCDIREFLWHAADEGWNDVYEVEEAQGKTLF